MNITEEQFQELIAMLAQIETTGRVNFVPVLGLAGAEEAFFIMQEFIANLEKQALAKEKTLQALHSENERLGLYKDAYAQRTWVGLTDDDTFEIGERLGLADVAWIDLMKAIEAKLKQKNG